jgi:hypothetical protein
MTAGEEISGEVLRLEEGSLYPALHRMEEAGSIRAAWIIKDNGRRARVYELTPGDADNSPAKRLAGRLSRRRCSASSSWHKENRHVLDRTIYQPVPLRADHERTRLGTGVAHRRSDGAGALGQRRAAGFGRRALLNRERSRDIKLLPWLDALSSDVVFGWRQLKRNRAGERRGNSLARARDRRDHPRRSGSWMPCCGARCPSPIPAGSSF